MCNILFTSDNFELLVIHDYANQIHVGIDKCLVWMRVKKLKPRMVQIFHSTPCKVNMESNAAILGFRCKIEIIMK